MTGSPLATVLIPTHDHAPQIGHAIRAVQAQTLGSFELFVVGDGTDDATRETVAELARSDGRIRYFDFPKGERHGEAHRHTALAEARGRIVAYCGDDDLWLPHHLKTMAGLLRRVDFGNALQIEVEPGGRLVSQNASYAQPEIRLRMVEGWHGFHGLTVWGHRMSAYRALPVGWSPAPPGTATDQHMFRKFAAQPSLRSGTALAATALHVQTPARPGWSNEARATELAALAARIGTEELCGELEALVRIARRVVRQPRRRRPT